MNIFRKIQSLLDLSSKMDAMSMWMNPKNMEKGKWYLFCATMKVDEKDSFSFEEVSVFQTKTKKEIQKKKSSLQKYYRLS